MCTCCEVDRTIALAFGQSRAVKEKEGAPVFGSGSD